MASIIRRFALPFVVSLVASVSLLTWATPAAAEKRSSKPRAGSVSVTGCLQKGTEANGYYITDEDQKMWELSSKSVKLGEHVGHRVTATGTTIQKSKAAEAKAESNEKSEASGKSYADLDVKSLKMVSESCQ